MGFGKDINHTAFSTDILEQLLDIFWKIIVGVLSTMFTKAIYKLYKKITMSVIYKL